MTRKTLVVALLAVLLGAGWLAAAARPIVGDWDCVATAPDGNEMPFGLKVKEDAGKLAGVAVFAEGGEVPLADPRFEDGVFTFKVTLDSGTYDVQLKVTGVKLDGTYKGAEASGPIKGTRKA